jgi:hypothetical protein
MESKAEALALLDDCQKFGLLRLKQLLKRQFVPILSLTIAKLKFGLQPTKLFY